MNTNVKGLLLKNPDHSTEIVTEKDHLKMVYLQLFYLFHHGKKWLVNVSVYIPLLHLTYEMHLLTIQMWLSVFHKYVPYSWWRRNQTGGDSPMLCILIFSRRCCFITLHEGYRKDKEKNLFEVTQQEDLPSSLKKPVVIFPFLWPGRQFL